MAPRQLAHYELLGLLGRGGMGEVHRARDTKLGREVALKILPAEVAGDAERLARFEREAQLLASLNHPNIAAIHGLEQADGQRFLVMELAEGEDLAERLRRGPIPVDEAIAIARQIAEGLEEAHEKSIVHRDLKPANVMVSAEGKVKILDFGLARAYQGGVEEEGDPALSPTITAAMTRVGTILGSAAYMSPEQAKGRALDRRTDIWAFGVILHEMVTGERLFSGETVSETMAAVLKDPIDLEALPVDLPPSIRVLLQRCLERDPRERLRDIGEARIHLRDPLSSSVLHEASASVGPTGTPASGSRRAWIPWSLAALLLVAWIGSSMLGGPPPESTDASPSSRLLRVSVEPPAGYGFHLTGTNPGHFVLSPDGRRAVFAARDEGGDHRLFLLDLALGVPEPIAGTEGGQYPFWSPDGQSIGYLSSSALRVLDLQARTDREIARTTAGKSGCWIDRDTIVFAAGATDGLSRVDLNTLEVSLLTDLTEEPASNSHRIPRSLGDGRHFLFTARLSGTNQQLGGAVMIGDAETGEIRELVRADGQAEYALGHVLYGLENQLYARPFDVEALEFTGPPALVAEDVGVIPGANLVLFSASGNGVLAYHPGERESLLTELHWYAVDGENLGTLGEPAGFGLFSISNDGGRVALTTYDNQLGTGDLFLHDLAADIRTRITFDTADESWPVWSPDDRLLYYLRSDNDQVEVLALEPDGREDPEVVLRDDRLRALDAVSPDGAYLSVAVENPDGGGLRAAVLGLDTGEIELVDADVRDSGLALFSPDGRWVAYGALVGGQWNLYLKTFPLSSRKWQITDRGAFWFAWDPEGDTLYHQLTGNVLHATAIDLSSGTPSVGRTEVAIDDFQTPLTDVHAVRMTPDGTRFLVSDGGVVEDDRPVRLVVGWPEIVSKARR